MLPGEHDVSRSPYWKLKAKVYSLPYSICCRFEILQAKLCHSIHRRTQKLKLGAYPSSPLTFPSSLSSPLFPSSPSPHSIYFSLSLSNHSSPSLLFPPPINVFSFLPLQFPPHLHLLLVLLGHLEERCKLPAGSGDGTSNEFFTTLAPENTSDETDLAVFAAGALLAGRGKSH